MSDERNAPTTGSGGSSAALVREALWRALGEASMNGKGDPPYMDRLLLALSHNHLEVRLVDAKP